MLVAPLHTMKIIRSVGLTAACVMTMACSSSFFPANQNGGSMTNRVDNEGNKNVLYDIEQADQTDRREGDDPMVELQDAMETKPEEFQARAARPEEPVSGLKRQMDAPIYVDLVPAVLDDNMQRAERSKGVVAEQIRREFVGDPIIKLTDEHKDRSGLLKPRLRVDSVVEVSPKVSLREAYGTDRKTGKKSKILAVIFEATITSKVPPATYTVSESGHVVKNVEVSKRFAKQVKQVILRKIGPLISAP